MAAYAKIAIIAAALSLALLCACSSLQNVSSSSSQKIQTAANGLLTDLQQKILPNREDFDKLKSLGYIAIKDGKTYGADEITMFYVAYDEKIDTSLTMIFSGSSFVVSRIVWIDGTGSYLRYEYDPAKPEDVIISGEEIDSLDIDYRQEPPKWELSLIKDKKPLKRFTFRNPVSETD